MSDRIDIYRTDHEEQRAMASVVAAKAAAENRAAEKVKHPRHYNNHPSGIECIQVARHMNFNLGNVLKYIWRVDEDKSGSGDLGVEDLRKAREYLDDEIDRRLKLYRKANGFANLTGDHE